MQTILLILSNFFACLVLHIKFITTKHHDNMVLLTLLKITQEIPQKILSLTSKTFFSLFDKAYVCSKG